MQTSANLPDPLPVICVNTVPLGLHHVIQLFELFMQLFHNKIYDPNMLVFALIVVCTTTPMVLVGI